MTIIQTLIISASCVDVKINLELGNYPLHYELAVSIFMISQLETLDTKNYFLISDII